MKYIIASLIIISILIFSCQSEPINIAPENMFGQLPKNVIHPSDNPTSAEKIYLGKRLFWDPILSGNKDVACVTCHHPNSGYAENLDLSIGVGGVGLSELRSGGFVIKRNAHTVLNTAYNGINGLGVYDPKNAPMFWDSRAKSLEEQAIQPIHDMKEMRGDKIAEKHFMDSIVLRLKAIPEYVTLFDKAFGANAINQSSIAKAIATFERTLVGGNSKFDRYAAGDKAAFSELEFRGMSNFIKAKCVSCHSGPMFSDFKLHVMGHGENSKLNEPDKGDGNFAFRTPTLRNISFTAPYMHNGTIKSLEEVIDFYEAVSGDGSENPNVATKQLDPIIIPIIAGNLKPMDLAHDQFASIVAFLKTLNDENFDKEILKSVPSGLHPGGKIK